MLKAIGILMLIGGVVLPLRLSVLSADISQVAGVSTATAANQPTNGEPTLMKPAQDLQSQQQEILRNLQNARESSAEELKRSSELITERLQKIETSVTNRNQRQLDVQQKFYQLFLAALVALGVLGAMILGLMGDLVLKTLSRLGDIVERTVQSPRLLATLAEQQASTLTEVRSSLEGQLQARQQAEEQLRRELSNVQEQLNAKTQTLRQEHERLEATTAKLLRAEASVVEVAASREKLERALAEERQLTASLREETKALAAAQRATVDQAQDLSVIKAVLEKETTERKDAETRLQRQYEIINTLRQDLTARTQAELEARRRLQEAESLLQNRADQFAQRDSALQDELAHRARLESELEGLTQTCARLAAEAEQHRQHHAELVVRLQSEQQRLEKALSAEASLRAQLNTAATEIDAVRGRVAAEVKQRESVEAERTELERAGTELAKELERSRQRDSDQQRELLALQSVIKQRTDELAALEVSIKAEVAERSRIDAEHKRINAALASAESQVRHLTETEQAQRNRHVQLEDKIRAHEGRLAGAAVELAEKTKEIHRFQQRNDELRSIQAVLCREVHDLASQQTSLVQTKTELESELEAKLADREKELAGLRYALLDAARTKATISTGHTISDRETTERARQLISALMNTSLSAAQMQMVSVLRAAVESWAANQIATQDLAPEAPAFSETEFSLQEVAESILKVIRMQAREAGIEVNTMISESAFDKLRADAPHLYQLVTSLAQALPHLLEVRSLDVLVATETDASAQTFVTFSFALLIAGDVQDKHRHLSEILRSWSAGSQQANNLSRAELNFTATSELARAMGGALMIDVVGETVLSLKLTVPVATSS